jgi:putative ABC transport system permease protein
VLRKLRAIGMRLRRVQNDEIDAELGSHVAMHTEDGVRAGLSPEEARRQALIQLGGTEQTRQAYRERATLPWMESLGRDVRYALRGFGRNPIFTITAIVTLALGIGATTAVFSVVDRILFRSLPYAHDDRLVSLGLSQSLEKQEFTLGGFFYEWRDNQRPFESITFERGTNECNLTEASPLHLHCGWVAGNFLSVLGVPLRLGRNFLPEEDEPNGPRVAILSDALWLSRYNRDPGVLNRTIRIDDRLYRMIGILPREFEMPRLQAVDILFPAQINIAAQHIENSGIGVPMWAFARLKPGVSVAEAREEMEPLFRHTQLWIPSQIRQDFHLHVRSIRDRQMQDAYAAARILLGAVLAVLFIACANVASLLSARRVARERELAVRSALGASRARLVRQALTEALLLAGAGALAGYLLAEVLLRIFISIAPSGIPFLASATIDARIVLFASVVSLLCAVGFGTIQAVESPRAESLVARSSLSRAHVRLRRILVTAQIAISVVLLASASLLMKSFNNLENQKLGMSTRNVLALHIPLTSQRYPSQQALMDFNLRAEAELRRVPGMTAVSISDSIPPDADSWHDQGRYEDFFVGGKPAAAPGVGGSVVNRKVTPNYFRVLQIPLIAGRNFREDERTSAGSSMILSKQLASRLFPAQNPLGRHIQFADYNPHFELGKTIYTVIGVAADVKNDGLASQELPEFYQLRRNQTSDWNTHTVVLLESALPAGTIAPWIRSRIAQIDPMVPVEIVPLRETVHKLADRPRFETALLGFFAITGLTMALIGLYGVIAFVATQRTQEIGVRMALGATRANILQLIAGEGVRLIMLGGTLGLIAALGAAQMLKSLLFQVGPRDPISFVAVVLLLGIVALLATLIPARSAMKTDPMAALRCE